MKTERQARMACRAEQNYFFTHLLEASSHFIVAIFSHAALVFGAPLAIAMPGATAPKAMAARMAVDSSFLDISHSIFFSGWLMITRAQNCARMFAAV